MNVKIYLKGRMLVFESTDGLIYEERLAWEVEPRQTRPNTGVYKFLARDMPILSELVEIGQILRENGTPYLQEEFETFIYQDSTPFFFSGLSGLNG